MSWFEDFLITNGSIADGEQKNLNKRKQKADKDLKQAVKSNKELKSDKSFNKDIKKLNATYNKAARKGSLGTMQKNSSRIGKTQ
jgi:hypothetical protein